MRKIVGYFILFVSVALNLCGASSQAKDLAIYFDVEEQPKARFYKHIMQDSVGFPVNRKSDPYHVTLLIVADVKDKDYSELASRLKKAVGNSSSSFSFTAHKASLLANDNGANGNQGTVILEPLAQEKLSFQALNRELVDVLARYNGEQLVSYGIRPVTSPSRYNPHLSIAKKEVFDKHPSLNRQGVVQTVNQALLGAGNTGIANMLSPKPQVKDLWAELKGNSRTVPVQPINPLPAPLPTPKPEPVVKRTVVAKRPTPSVRSRSVVRRPASSVRSRPAARSASSVRSRPAARSASSVRSRSVGRRPASSVRSRPAARPASSVRSRSVGRRPASSVRSRPAVKRPASSVRSRSAVKRPASSVRSRSAVKKSTPSVRSRSVGRRPAFSRRKGR